MRYVNIKILILIISSFFSLNVSSQLFTKNVKNFSINALGEIIILKTDNQLIKYDSLGNQLFTYTNNYSTSLSSFDATDAMNLMLYYNDFGRVSFLDKSLSEKLSPIELFNLGFSSISTVCLSYNNGIWIYDLAESQLIRINNNRKIEITSNRLNEILPVKIDPSKMIEFNNQLYVSDSLSGIYLFDKYGAFIKQVFNGKCADFQAIDEGLLISDANRIIFIPTIGLSIEMYFTSPDFIKSFLVQASKIWILNQNHELIKFNRE